MEPLRKARAAEARETPSRIGPEAADTDCRCRCGSLVARIAVGGVEIKCRRCKRTLLVPWSARGGWTAVESTP